MAILKDLIVNGISRFLGHIYGNNITTDGVLNVSENQNSASDLAKGINVGSIGHIGTSTGLGLYSKGGIWIRPSQTSLDPIDSNIGLNITNSIFTYNNNTIWNEGNDGADSGLDADLLDGLHGSYYAKASDIPQYVICTLNAYNEMSSHDPDTYYIILENGEEV